MRPAILLLVALFAAPPGLGESWTDQEGDHEIGIVAAKDPSGTVWLPPGTIDGFDYADILSIRIDEPDAATLRFTVELASFESASHEPEFVNEVEFPIPFEFNGEQFRARIIYDVLHPEKSSASLERLSANIWRPELTSVVVVDPEANTVSAGFEKWEIRDASEQPLIAGSTLEGLSAQASRTRFGTGVPFIGPTCIGTDGTFIGPLSIHPTPECSVVVRDSVDDMTSYLVTQTPLANGDFLMESPQPLRGSNGLETTYIYEVRIFPVDGRDGRILLEAQDVPEGWEVFHAPWVESAKDTWVTVPIGVSVPMAHHHGVTETFTVHAFRPDSTDDVSSVELGVAWTEVPQPSGHHPALYVHAASNGASWMNTLQEDDLADLEGVPPDDGLNSFLSQDGQPNYVRREWSIPLQPELLLGLDFHADSVVSGTLGMIASGGLEGDLDVSFVHRGPEEETVLAAIEDHQFSFSGDSGTADLEVPLKIDEYAIPPKEAHNLWLEVLLEGNQGSTNFGEGITEPSESIMIDSATTQLVLPLNEYHDVIDATLGGAPRIQLQTPGDSIRVANPGDTVSFEAQVLNRGSYADTITWRVEGPASDWVELQRETSSLEPGAKQTLGVAVHIPEDPPETGSNFLLIAYSEESEGPAAFQQYFIDIETDREIDSEEIPWDVEKTTPGPGILGVIGTLVIAVFVAKKD